MNHSLIPQTYARGKWEVLGRSVDPIEWCQRKKKLLEVDREELRLPFFFCFLDAHSLGTNCITTYINGILHALPRKNGETSVDGLNDNGAASQPGKNPYSLMSLLSLDWGSVHPYAIKSLFHNSGLSMSHVKTAATLFKTPTGRWDSKWASTLENVLYFQGKE